MNDKKLEYSLTSAEVNYLLNVLGRTQTSGVEQAKELIYMAEKLQKPNNKEDMEKDQYEQLKTKFDKKAK